MLIEHDRIHAIAVPEDPILPDPPPLATTAAKADDPTKASTAVSIGGVTKRFGRYPALNDVSLDIAPGELLALLGPSGSGKTTLLRMLAGLEFPDGGAVSFDGQDMTFVRAAERGIGFVFQQYALFKHMTVAKNISFGLDVKRGRDKPGRQDRASRVEELLKLVELEGLGKRYPSQLSGGQRQRVALARALGASPKVLLLDEPFGALDATVRKTLRRELRRIHDATGVTTVFVTHDQDEALNLADRVAVLNKGRIEQVGDKADLLDHPKTAFVAGFVGESNQIVGQVRDGWFHALGARLPAGARPDGPAVAYVRPQDIALAAPNQPAIEAILIQTETRGHNLLLECRTEAGQTIEILAPQGQASGITEPGATVRFALQSGHIFAAA